MNKFAIRIRNPFQYSSIYIYFISVLILSVIDNTYTTALFYLSALMCMLSLLHMKPRLDAKIFLILVITLACGVANIYLIGNLNYVRLLVLFLSFFVGQLFLNERIDAKVFLNVYLIYALFLLFRIATQGLGNPIFTYVSNNYASVYLLCPLLIYYIKNEQAQDKINLYPAIGFWIICALTTSRMGLLTASFILGGLILYKSHKANGKVGAKIIIVVLLLFMIPLAFYLLPLLASKYSDLYIIQRFMNMGLTSSARTRMWSEYIELLNDTKYLLFGAPTDEVYWAARFYEGNVHNSYMTVHAYLGIIGFIGLVLMIIRSIYFGFKNKKFVYLIMLVGFCIRAVTDHVFGCNRISPIILFLIFLPFMSEYASKQILQWDLVDDNR